MLLQDLPYHAGSQKMLQMAQNVQGMQVPNSGHWIPEERPDIIIKLLNNFFGGNTTKPSSQWLFLDRADPEWT